jgi:nucleotide-binding universal stress UspA family protein
MTAWLFAGFALFLCIGIVTAVVMGRHGHDPWTWGVVGTLFGPLVIPLVIGWHWRDRRSEERVVHLPEAVNPNVGGISVLVGIDGSAESATLGRTVVDLFGTRLGALTLATVVDFDAMEAMHTEHSAFEQNARALLANGAAEVEAADPTTVILGGRPADALLEYARRHDIDLIAIGARGKGLSQAVLGSVAEQLIRQRYFGVLVAGPYAVIAHEPAGA